MIEDLPFCTVPRCHGLHLLLFFQRDRAHRHLHSFPTRRSSDLPSTGGAGSCCARDTWRAMRSDRKSTRLNSSHPSSSYAVFCLKKKRGSVAPLRYPRGGVLRADRGTRRDGGVGFSGGNGLLIAR